MTILLDHVTGTWLLLLDVTISIIAVLVIMWMVLTVIHWRSKA